MNLSSHSATALLPTEAAMCRAVLPWRSVFLPGCEQVPPIARCARDCRSVPLEMAATRAAASDLERQRASQSGISLAAAAATADEDAAAIARDVRRVITA